MAFPPTKFDADAKRPYQDDLLSAGNSISTHGGDSCSKGTDDNGDTSISKPRKRMKIIDETLLPPDEAEKLLAKRAYNRECANRARYRGKQITNDLNKKIQELEEDKRELRRSLKDMEKLLEQFKAQNEKLQLQVSMFTYNNTNSSSMGLLPSTISNSAAMDHHLPSLSQQRITASITPSMSSLSTSFLLNHHFNQKIQSPSATLEYLNLVHNLNK